MLTRYSSSIFSLKFLADSASSVTLQATLHGCSSIISNWGGIHILDPHPKVTITMIHYHLNLSEIFNKFKKGQQTLTVYTEFSIRSPRRTSPKFSALLTIVLGLQYFKKQQSYGSCVFVDDNLFTLTERISPYSEKHKHHIVNYT